MPVIIHVAAWHTSSGSTCVRERVVSMHRDGTCVRERVVSMHQDGTCVREGLSEYAWGGKALQQTRILQLRWVLLLLSVLYVLLFVPLPYVIYEPGLAQELTPLVRTEAPAETGRGAFLLTTVRQTPANVFGYVQAVLSRNRELAKKSDVYRDGQSRKEYNELQSVVMQNSQSNAIMAVYRKLGIAYQVRAEKVVVLSVNDRSPSADLLEPGDVIVAVGGDKVRSMDDLRGALAGRRIGERVALRVERGGKPVEIEAEVTDLSALHEEVTEPTPGFGISIGEVRGVVPEDEAKRVNISVHDIGGPSAGLMFALEIYDRMTPGDLTGGHRIAGTGTIDEQGRVGDIGGVRFKIVAAGREGAEYFLAPPGNVKEAENKAREAGIDITVVPVRTLDEAIEYIEGLPPAK